MEKKDFNRLRQRAEFILANQKENPTQLKDLHQMIHDLNLYQIEIELQQENLLKTQSELEESQNKYLNLYDLAPIGYITMDQNGLILEINQPGAELFDIDKQSLVNRSFSRYISPEFQNIFHSLRLLALEKMTLQSAEIKLIRKNGPLFYAQLNIKAVINSMTGNKELLTFICDISERKQSEQELHARHINMSLLDRSNSMGELASIMAHELNHPLGVISNYINGCIKRMENDEYIKEEILDALCSANKQLQRATEIILRMKNLSSHSDLKHETNCLDNVIRQAMTLIEYESLDFPLQINYHATKYLPPLVLDKTHIQQVILNLGRNAIESLRDAGTSNPKLTIEVNHINMSTVEISIMDNGPGVKDAHLPELFNPTFTTKPYGVGLGLAVCRTIIESHGGKLSVTRNPTGGACFKFTLPIKTETLKNTNAESENSDKTY
jgi:PAS domain S-box-containing protein